MPTLPGCAVNIITGSHTGMYVVKAEHYQDLRDRLDRGETGWVELDSVHGDGRAFIRLETISDLFLATDSFVEERDAWDAQCKVTGDG